MDGKQFDTLTRLIATSRTRRQFVRAVGGGALAALAGLAGEARAGAADCASGVICRGRCCDDASDICLRDRCTSCPSGVICRDRCCAVGETCQDRRCVAELGEPGPCLPLGAACTADGDCCSTVCAHGACAACPPGSRECDGVCYPGGCCTDADCGDPCLTCGSDHACHGCPPGQTCQGHGCTPVCTPATCQAGQCGSIPDGCGGTLDCGECANGQPCQQGRCCVPTTCDDQDAVCGSIPDGCGGTLQCGACDASKCQTCDAASNLCFSACTRDQICCNDACKVKQGGTGCTSDADCCDQVCHQGTCCSPTTCAAQGATCGTIDDGCGGTIHCGDCDPCEYCYPHTCVSMCTTGQVCIDGGCCEQDACPTGACGSLPDGCGGTHECDCPTGQQCQNGKCCIPDASGGCCTPYICRHFGDDSNCGKIDDGCGNTIDCGDCEGDEVCLGGICCIPDCRSGPCTNDACGGICPCSTGQICYQGTCCAPATCDSGRCGTFDDGCGSTLHCGSCDASKCETCGADHICHGCDSCSVCNEEGSCFSSCESGQICIKGTCCTPATCAGKGVSCGSTDNGCGGTLDCGDCAVGQVCVKGSCCTTTTCAAQGVTCGTISDGCGGTLDCGTCASGEVCVNYGCFKTTTPDCAKCCPRGQFCPDCFCTDGFDGTTHHLCVLDTTEIDCFGGNKDCPHGQVCYPSGDPPTCSPPC